MRSGYWQELKTTEFAGLDPERTVAIFPVAAIEQHGPHLPLATDALINDGIVRAALPGIPDDVIALFLPALNFGTSTEHHDFPGTLSVDSNALLETWLQIGRDVARAGVRKLVILNSHGGQRSLVDLAAIRLRVSHEMFVVRCNYFAFGAPENLFSSQEWATGLHGGEVETSLMLHLHPELVDLRELANHAGPAQDMSRENRWLGAEKPVGFGWKAQDLNPSGVCGNAADADAGKGAAYLAHLGSSFVELLQEVAQTPLSVLR